MIFWTGLKQKLVLQLQIAERYNIVTENYSSLSKVEGIKKG